MKKMRKIITAQNIAYKNDINGNPQRIYVIYDRKFNLLGWCDDGYSGENFAIGRKVKWLPTVRVSSLKELKRHMRGAEFKNESY